MDSVDEIARKYYRENGKVMKLNGLPLLDKKGEIALSKSIDKDYRTILSAALDYFKAYYTINNNSNNTINQDKKNLREGFSKVLGTERQIGLENRLNDEPAEKVALDYFHPDNKTEIDRKKIEDLAKEIYEHIEKDIGSNSEIVDEKFKEFNTIYRSCSRKISQKKEEFALRNLRLVRKYAIAYAVLVQEEKSDETGRISKTFFESDDFFNEGYFGLLKAVDKFDHRKGFKFSTYATWWIKESIQRHVHENYNTIRKPAPIIEVYQSICAVKNQLELKKTDPSNREIAEEYIRKKIFRALTKKEFVFEDEYPTLDKIISTIEEMKKTELNLLINITGSGKCHPFSSKNIRQFVEEEITKITEKIPEIFNFMALPANLEQPIFKNYKNEGSVLKDFIKDPEAEIEFSKYETGVLHRKLEMLMETCLNEKEKSVICHKSGITRGVRGTTIRAGKEKPDNNMGMKFKDIGALLGFSSQRTEQIHKEALRKLQEAALDYVEIFEPFLDEENAFIEDIPYLTQQNE